MAYLGHTGKLPIGREGFTGSQNPSQIKGGELPYMEGMAIDAGILQKDGGAAKLNAAALASGADILAGISWSPAPGTLYDVVFTGAGTLLRDDGAGTFGTTYESGLTPVATPPPWFAPGGGESVGDARKLFFFSASNQVYVAAGTGATTAPIAAPPADWAASFPTFGLMHGRRMWAGGNSSDPHRMYYSLAADHEDFTTSDAGSLAIYPGEGDMLVGAVSFKGLLVVFKYPTGVYVIDTTDPTPANWQVYPLSRAVGGVNQHTIVPIENDVMYLSHTGNLHLLSATQNQGAVNSSNISQIADLGPFMRREVNLVQIRKAVGVWYGAKNQVWFGLPATGATENGIRLVADFNDPEIKLRFLTTRRDALLSLWMRLGADGIQKPTAGDSVGFVWLLDTDARNKDGVGYEFRFETANMDLSFIDPSLATKVKNGQFLEIVIEPRGDWDLELEIYWDDILHDTMIFSMGSTGVPLGTFELGVDALSSDVVKSIRKRLVGSGRRLRLIGFNDGLDQDVAIAEFWLSLAVADERTREDA